MDFVGGALPNVMLVAGLIAIGLGLGIEFQVVQIKGDLSRTSRVGAILVGMVLIGGSVYLYTRPPQTATSAADTPAAAAPTLAAAAIIAAPDAPSAPAATAPAPTAAPVVQVPDIRGKNAKDAQKTLTEVGLLYEASQSGCATLAATTKEDKLKKDQIACQLPEPGSSVAAGTQVVYVLAGDNK